MTTPVSRSQPSSESELADFIYEVHNFTDAKEKAALLWPRLAQLASARKALEDIKNLKSKPLGVTGFAIGPQALFDQAQRIARATLKDISK